MKNNQKICMGSIVILLLYQRLGCHVHSMPYSSGCIRRARRRRRTNNGHSSSPAVNPPTCAHHAIPPTGARPPPPRKPPNVRPPCDTADVRRTGQRQRPAEQLNDKPRPEIQHSGKL